MSTDIENRLNVALVTILNADTGVQALTGRSTSNLIPWQDPGDGALPRLMYVLMDCPEIGGAGDNRLAQYRITAMAEGANAQAVTADLIERVEVGLTEPLLSAQGVAAFPQSRRRRRVPVDPEASRGLQRADLDITLFVTK